MDFSNQIAALRAVVEHIRSAQDWVVVLGTRALERALIAVRPPGASMAGRTLLMPSGGRVTVLSVAAPFNAKGFLLMEAGLRTKMMPSVEIALHLWRQQADGTVMLDGSNALRIKRK